MDYDTWKTTNPSEYDCNPSEDFVHVDELNKYDDATQRIEEMVNSFYRTGDLHKFEDAFEELASIFEVNLPYANPKFVQTEEEDNNLPLIKNKVKVMGE